ncbi:hypothetical protein CF326_g6990 [Tilletia indica]|nr:hypothetical protein CF326_g6990 [Tilletia indica]
MVREAIKMGKEKLDVYVVVIGHVDSDKSTSTGNLLSTIQEEGRRVGKGSFMYAWDRDKLKAKRKRGTTINITLQNFETPKYNVTNIGHPATGLHQEDGHWLLTGRLRHSHHRR